MITVKGERHNLSQSLSLETGSVSFVKANLLLEKDKPYGEDIKNCFMVANGAQVKVEV